MRRDRVVPLHEARSDYVKPVRRATPLPRALEVSGDPDWLHAGRTLRVPLRGDLIDVFPISAMARALGRSSESVRRLIREGVLPEARYRSPARTEAGRKRLWTREELLAVAVVAEELGVRGRRPRRWSDSELAARLAATNVTV